jgi:hypothetical protein
MGVTISSWMTVSSGWQTMNRMQAATFSGDWRFSGGGGGSRILKKLVLIPPATTAITLMPCSLPCGVQRLRQAHDAVLGGGVGGRVGPALLGSGRGDVDDLAPPRSTMCGKTARESSQGARRLTCWTRSHSARVISVAERIKSTPASLTRMSMRFSESSISCTVASAEVGSATSTVAEVALG